MDFHFATAWEAIADAIPDAPALICGDLTRSWRAFDDRAARLATTLVAAGLSAGSKVGIYLHNSNEYLETQFAAFKFCGSPVNLSYRFKADALVHLLDHADVEAVVYQSCHSARIWEIQRRLPKVKCFIEVADGTENIPVKGRLDYESGIREQPPLPRRDGRPADDLYMLYTAGTTGMPKAVMYANGALCKAFASVALTDQGAEAPSSIAALARRVRAMYSARSQPVSLPACPLMHGTGMWLGAMVPLLAGGAVVTIPGPGVDPERIWDEVRTHRVTGIAIVGDVTAKPLLAALDLAVRQGRPFDLTSLRRITSSGVPWSIGNRQGLLAHRDMVLCDVMGSTEGSIASAHSTRARMPATGVFGLAPGTRVFADDGSEVRPGSGAIGTVATSGHATGMAALGYYRDPAGSAAAFRDIDGVRYAFPGDCARVEADGTLRLLGRGSRCIDAAGARVFPEEVEEALMLSPVVLDCVVVGHATPNAGEQLIALAAVDEDLLEQPEATEAAILAFARDRLDGARLPRRVLLVPEVRRTGHGVPDYGWARQEAALYVP